jgi:hypothetical protein
MDKNINKKSIKNNFKILCDSDEDNNNSFNENSEWKIVQIKKKEKNITNAIGDFTLKNKKKILCNNILKKDRCEYGNKCLYAHDYNEQNIDDYKKNLYDLIKSDKKVDIELNKNENLFRQLVVFSKICNECINKKCSGGYNCKYGIFDRKYQICYKNILNDSCSGCNLIHLTDKGIKPFYYQKKNINLDQLPNGIIVDDKFFINKEIKEKKEKENNKENNDSDDDLLEEEVIDILVNNEEDIDMCNVSIFDNINIDNKN